MVCKLAVEHQFRYTKRVDLPTDVSGAGGVFSSQWRCVSVLTQRRVWTPLSKKKKTLKISKPGPLVLVPLLVISTVVNNETSLPDLGLPTKSKVDERLQMFL